MSPNPQILLNFDAWKSSLEERQRRAIENQLSLAPDRDAETRKIQNIFWIAGEQRLKPGQVNSRYDDLLGAHAVRAGWGPILDTGAFNAKAREAALAMDNENKLVKGMDGDNEEAAKARESSLVAKAYWAATNQLPVAPPELPASALYFQDWQREAKAHPGYSAKNAERYWRTWDRAYSAGRQDFEIARNAARDVLAQVGDGAEADVSADAFKTILPRLRGLSPQQRALTFQQLAEQAKDSGLSGGVKLFGSERAGKATVVMQRAITAIEKNLGDFVLPFGARSDGAQWKGGEKVDARLFNQFVERFGGEPMSLDSFPELVATVTPEMATFLNAKAAEGYQDRATLDSLREIAQGKMLPIKKDGIIDYAVLGAAESLPTMALAAAGLPGAAVLFVNYSASAERDLVEKGLTRQQAQSLAPTIGAVQMVFDKAELALFIKMPGLGGILKKWGTASPVTQFAGRVLATTVLETGQELGQDVLAPAFVQEVGSWLDDNIPGVNAGKVWEDVVKAAPETFLSMLLLPILGAGRATWRDIQDARTVMNPDALAAYGLTEEEIQTVGVAVAKGPKEGVAAFRDVWKSRLAPDGPKVVPSYGSRGISFVRPLKKSGEGTAMPADQASTVGTTESVPQASITGTFLSPTDPTITGTFLSPTDPTITGTFLSPTDPTITGTFLSPTDLVFEPTEDPPSLVELEPEKPTTLRRDDDGWKLVFEDGKEIRAGSVEAALHMQASLKRATSEREAAAIVGLADEIAWRSGGDVRYSQTFSSDTINVSEGEVSRLKLGETKAEKVTFELATARNLDAQLKFLGSASGVIQGSNWIRQDGTRMLATNQTREGVFTQLHEFAESRFRDIMREDSGASAVAAARVAMATGLFDPAKQRNAEDAKFAQSLANIAAGKSSETEARETLVELAVADVLGKRRGGRYFTPGIIKDGVAEMLKGNLPDGMRKTLTGFMAMLKAVRAYVQGVFSIAAKLQRARREGTVVEGDALTKLLDEMLGVPEQRRHNEAVLEEVGASDYVDPDSVSYNPAEGEAFSIGGGMSTAPGVAQADSTPPGGLTEAERLQNAGFPPDVIDYVVEIGLVNRYARDAGGFEAWPRHTKVEIEEETGALRRMQLQSKWQTAYDNATESERRAIADAAERDAMASAAKWGWSELTGGWAISEKKAESGFRKETTGPSLFRGRFWRVSGYSYNKASAYATYENAIGEKLSVRISDHDKPSGHETGSAGDFALYAVSTTRSDAQDEILKQIHKNGLNIETLENARERFPVAFRNGMVMRARPAPETKRAAQSGASQDAPEGSRAATSTQPSPAVNEQSPAPADEQGATFSIKADRVTPAQDAEYMAAVESGDMETAQRMVDAAAKAAGYDVGPVYHGSAKQFDAFKIDSVAWFAVDKNAADGFATRRGQLVSAYLRINNPLTLPLETVKIRNTAYVAQSNGHDALIAEETGDYAVFDPNQIKSADPVTRDESGAVIPLSKRFDSSRDEITFSLADESALETIARRIEQATPVKPEARLASMQKSVENLKGIQRVWLFNDSQNAPFLRTQAAVERQRRAMRKARETELLDQVEADFRDLEEARELASPTNSPFLSELFRKKSGDSFPRSRIARRPEDYQGGSYDGATELPQWMFSKTGETPDNLAKELHGQGLLRGDTAMDLWVEIEKTLKQSAKFKETLKKYRERRAEAKATAREEAAAWAEAQNVDKDAAAEQRKEVTRSLVALDAILYAAPAEIRGKVGGFVALSRLTTDKARIRFLLGRVDKMVQVYEKWLKDEYTDKLEKLIDRANDTSKPGEKARGAIGPQAHRFFAAVGEVVGMTAVQVEAKQAELENELTRPRAEGEADLTDDEAANIFEKQQVLDLFGNLKDKNAAELSKAYEAAQTVYKEGRNRWRITEEARLAEVRAIGDGVIEVFGGAGYKAIQGSKANARGLRAKANSIRLELKNFGGFLKEILGEDNEIAARWTSAARKAMQFTETARRALKDEWKAKIEEATGKKGRAARLEVWGMVQNQTIDVVLAGAAKTSTRSVPESVLEDIMDGTIDPRDVGLTRAQADALIGQEAGKPLEVKETSRGPSENIQLSESEGIFITMLAAQEQYEKGLDAAGFTGDAITAIEEALSPAAKILRSWMRGKYADNYKALNAVFSRMFGVDLAQIENYAPAAFYHTGDANAKGPEDSTMQEGGFRSNFLKTRKKHRAAPRLENAFAAFFGHAAQSAHWQGFAELVREMRGVMARPDVKMAMEGRHGREVSGLMSDWLKNIEGNGISRAHGALDAFTGWLLRQAAYVHLAYNVGTLVVQSTAALGAAWKIGAGQYMRGLGKLMAGRLDVKAMWNSDLIQNRLANGYAPEVRAALNDLWSAKPSLRQDFLEKGMELIGFVDAFWTTASAAIAYDAHYREAKAAGMSEESAKAIAMARTEETVGETAQPSTITEKSLFEAKQGNLAKLAFLYASESRQKTAMLVGAWKKAFTLKATRQDVQVLILAHLIIGPALQFMRAALRDMKDDDDEELFDKKHWQKPGDWIRSIALGPLNGIPLVGDLFSGYTSDNAAVGRFKEAGSSAISILKGPEAGTAEKGEWYWNRAVRVLKGMDAATAVGAGIADQVFKTADNFSE